MIAKIEFLTKQLNKAISTKNINLLHLTQLEALRQLSKILGYTEKQHYPIDIERVERHIRCMYIKNMPFRFYAANAMILDTLFLRWRECVDVSVLGYVISRTSKEVRDWRKAVLKRDNKKCVDCGKDKRLHAHHVLSWAEHPEFRINISNGITLCGDCHSERHPELAKGFVS